MSGSVVSPFGLPPATLPFAGLQSGPDGRPPAPQDQEPPDMTGQFNTPLSPADEAKYQAWGASNMNGTRNPANDTYDYDMRGFWKAGNGNPTFADNGHAGDQFKKPNHPTFSNQSQYSGQGGYTGGSWSADGADKTYAPSSTNLQMHGASGLQRYFSQREPDYTLLSGQTPAPVPAAQTGLYGGY